MPVEILELSSPVLDSTGNLRVLESDKLRGLKFQRFFFLDGFEQGQLRGDHAHKKCWQLIFILGGTVECQFQTIEGSEIKLNAQFPSAFLVPPMIWVRLMFFGQESRVMVAATDAFDEADYIRVPGEFFLT